MARQPITDQERLAWCLPLIAEPESEAAEARDQALRFARAVGHTGTEAIDYAMRRAGGAA